MRYASERHYREHIYCTPVPVPVNFSETVVVASPNCTWRHYKSEVYLQPRHRPLRYQSTAIVYPKHARSTCRTTLSHQPSGAGRRWFSSTVRLESSEDLSPCIIYTEDL